jgi:FkbM family methyltransferase
MNLYSWTEKVAVCAVAFYLRHTPFSKGRYRLIHTFLPLLRDIREPMGTRRIRTRLGFKMNVDLAEWIGQHIYMTGNYEPETTSLICSLVREGDTIVDVGANIGFITLAASRKVGPSGKVLAFEPVSSTCASLRHNLLINNASNVVVHEIALSNACGMVTIHEGPIGNKGCSSIRHISNASGHRTVPMAPFDALDVSREAVRLVKIDVEGAEQLVVQGMMEFLKRSRPHTIVEVSRDFLREFGHSEVSLCKKLTDIGYHMYHVTDKGPIPMRDLVMWPHQFNALFSFDSRLSTVRGVSDALGADLEPHKRSSE